MSKCLHTVKPSGSFLYFHQAKGKKGFNIGLFKSLELKSYFIIAGIIFTERCLSCELIERTYAIV